MNVLLGSSRSHNTYIILPLMNDLFSFVFLSFFSSSPPSLFSLLSHALSKAKYILLSHLISPSRWMRMNELEISSSLSLSLNSNFYLWNPHYSKKKCEEQ